MKLRRKRSANLNSFSGARLREDQLCSVKKIAAQRRQISGADAQVSGGAVQRITNDGMFKGREMHANLMGAAGVQSNFHERSGVHAQERAPISESFAGIGELRAMPGLLLNGHAHAAQGIATNGQCNAAGVFFQRTLHQGDVSFIDGALAESFAEFGMSRVIFCYEDYAGSFFVEAVNDAGAQEFSRMRERLAATEKRVDESAGRNARAGVDGHAGRFIYRDDVIVFVKDIERNGFGFGAHWRALLRMDLDALAAVQSMRTFGSVAIHEDQARFDEFFYAGAAKNRTMGGNQAIEPLACFGRVHFEEMY